MSFGYMRLVLTKIFRDLRKGWLSFGACLSMMVLSVALFLAFFTASYSLERSINVTYDSLKFLDFTLNVNRVSRTELSRIASIPEVTQVSGRTTLDIKLLLDPSNVPPSRSEFSKGKLIGLPHETRTEVNDIYIVEGSYFSQPRGEALLETRFAHHHNIKVGDSIRVVPDHNSVKTYRVVGLVSSPEFIWMTMDRFDPRPADKRFAVLFVTERDVETAAGGAAINEIHVKVDSPDNLESVITESESRLEGKLSDSTVRRSEQPSNALLLRDQAAFKGLSIFFPAIFLSLSFVTLFTTLWQLVSRQRRQIGILMSQGCSSHNLLLQYLLLGAVIGALGAVGGVAVGIPLGHLSTNFYTNVLGLPFVEVLVPIQALIAIVILVLILSVTASWVATRRILNLDPIRAIRMEFQEGWAPRGETFWDTFLPTRMRFAVRNLARNPGRGVLSTLGIAVSVAQIVMTLALFDSQEKTINYYFERVHKYDFETVFTPRSQTDLPRVNQWPEVEYSEPVLRHSTIVEFDDRKLPTNVWGLPTNSELLRLYDLQRQRITTNSEPYIYMGPVQMARLGVRPGDRVSLSLHEGDRETPKFSFVVAPAVHEPLAHPPKIELRQLQHILQKSLWGGTPDTVNTLLIRAKPGMAENLQNRLSKDSRFLKISSPAEMRDEVEELLRMFNAYKYLLLGFTSIFALVVLLSTTTMNVMERRREFATLSCLGVSDGQLAGLLLSETLILWVGGLTIGIPSGILLGQTLLNNFQKQLLQLDLTLGVGTVALTSLLSLLICVVAIGNGLARLRDLPLTAATQDAS